jgi:hypothetical protein
MTPYPSLETAMAIGQGVINGSLSLLFLGWLGYNRPQLPAGVRQEEPPYLSSEVDWFLVVFQNQRLLPASLTLVRSGLPIWF